MSNSIIPNVAAGTVIGGSPTFPANAIVRGDSLYVRDANGNQIPGCSVDDGDEITVLDIGYTRQLALVQYPTRSGYKQGYVTNATNIIHYKDNYSWANGSTSEEVYDLDKTTRIGSLDPRERAVVLYKVDGMTAVVYDTGKGKLTKSGLVHYAGTGGGSGSTGSGGGSVAFNGIRAGQVVSTGFTYANNAQVVGDELYLRDENGNRIPGRSVSNGDKITVLDVGYTKQLALVQYQGNGGVIQGYVTNATNIIKYFNSYTWHNGTTPEEVLDENGHHLGSLSPHESATPLYTRNGMIHVVYDTNKGAHTKSGFVKYAGTSPVKVDIPTPAVTNAQRIVYGTSGRGRDLTAYKIGNGSNSLVMVCAIHGWEDHWTADGIELTKIGNGLIEYFQNVSTNNFSLYIIPAANPDGLAEGSSHNGVGRCTVVNAIDCNRSFSTGFDVFTSSRNHTGPHPFTAVESKKLSEFILGVKNNTSGETYVIDLHGWEDKTIGDPKISQCFENQFGFRNGNKNNIYPGGFLISWANSIGAKSALIELPESCYSHNDVVNGGYLQKIRIALTNLMGSSGSTSTVSNIPIKDFNATGVVKVPVLNVRTGPGTNYDVIHQLHKPETISIVGTYQDWYKIKHNSSYAYVYSNCVNLIETNTPSNNSASTPTYTESYEGEGVVVNVTTSLNVRSGASTNHDVIGSLHCGQEVKIIGRNKEWYEIKYNGRNGFVHKDYINITFQMSSISTVKEEKDLEEEDAHDKAAKFVEKLFGYTETIQSTEETIIINGPIKVTFAYGLESHRYAKSLYQFAFNNGKFTCTDKKGQVLIDILSALNGKFDQIKSFTAKFKKSLTEDSNIILEFNPATLSISLKIEQSLYEDKKTSTGCKLFYTLKISLDKDNLCDAIGQAAYNTFQQTMVVVEQAAKTMKHIVIKTLEIASKIALVLAVFAIAILALPEEIAATILLGLLEIINALILLII